MRMQHPRPAALLPVIVALIVISCAEPAEVTTSPPTTPAPPGSVLAMLEELDFESLPPGR